MRESKVKKRKRGRTKIMVTALLDDEEVILLLRGHTVTILCTSNFNTTSSRGGMKKTETWGAA